MIGQKIKRIREIKGYKQEFMADKLNISQQSYSNIEGDRIDVPFSKIEEIASVFNMRVEDIVSFDEKFVLNNYGEIKGNQIGLNAFPTELKSLYDDKIKLLEDKVNYQQEYISELRETIKHLKDAVLDSKK
jgi:transcriptional regulator with XRE-family HTH domain